VINGKLLFILTQVGRKLESLPPDLAEAAVGGGITSENMWRFVEMEGLLLLSFSKMKSCHYVWCDWIVVCNAGWSDVLVFCSCLSNCGGVLEEKGELRQAD
jgi:hypothetical protein